MIIIDWKENIGKLFIEVRNNFRRQTYRDYNNKKNYDTVGIKSTIEKVITANNEQNVIVFLKEK